MWLKELNLFFECDSKNCHFFFSMTQRIEPSFFEHVSMNWTPFYDSKNWTFFQYDSKNVSFNKSMFPRIEPLFSDITQRIEPLFFWYDSKNWTFFECDSKNWTLKVTPRIEPFFECDSKIWTSFLNVTQNFELICLKELNLIFWKKKMTRRIELWFFWIWLSKKCFLWMKITLIIQPFFMTQRIELFLKYDSMTWALFRTWLEELNFSPHQKNDSRNWTLLFSWLTELNPSFQHDSQKLNPSFQHDSKNWTFFFAMWLKELNTSWNMTERIQCFFFWLWLKGLNLFYMTQRMNLFFFWHDSKNWSFFWTRLIDLFF